MLHFFSDTYFFFGCINSTVQPQVWLTSKMSCLLLSSAIHSLIPTLNLQPQSEPVWYIYIDIDACIVTDKSEWSCFSADLQNSTFHQLILWISIMLPVINLPLTSFYLYCYMLSNPLYLSSCYIFRPIYQSCYSDVTKLIFVLFLCF